MRSVWLHHKHISEQLRLCLYNAFIIPMLTYNMGTLWRMKESYPGWTPMCMCVNVKGKTSTSSVVMYSSVPYNIVSFAMAKILPSVMAYRNILCANGNFMDCCKSNSMQYVLLILYDSQIHNKNAANILHIQESHKQITLWLVCTVHTYWKQLHTRKSKLSQSEHNYVQALWFPLICVKM